jgi:hypothetical protein
MYPYVSADGSKIVCSTPNGEAYLIMINEENTSKLHLLSSIATIMLNTP